MHLPADGWQSLVVRFATEAQLRLCQLALLAAADRSEMRVHRGRFVEWQWRDFQHSEAAHGRHAASRAASDLASLAVRLLVAAVQCRPEDAVRSFALATHACEHSF